MNFQSILEELDKLYDAEVKKAEEAKVEEEPVKEALVEAAEEAVEEVADDEEIEIVDDEVEVKLVLACEGCGALMIKAEADVKFDDESGLANVGEACQYCEAEDGYKAIGTFAPYEAEEAEEESVEEVAEVEAEEAAEEEIAEEEIVADDIVEDEAVEESLEEVDAEEELEEGIFSRKPSHVLIAKSDNGKWYSIVAGSDLNKLKAREKEAKASYDKHGVNTATKIVDYKTAQKMTGEKDPSSQENLDK